MQPSRTALLWITPTLKPSVKRSRVDHTGASSLPGAPHRPRLALAYTNGHVARPSQPRLLQNPTTSRPGSDDHKGRHLAQEVDAAMRNRNPEQQRAAARHLIRDASFPEHLTRKRQRELDLDGAPGSLAHLYGLIAPVSDYRLPSSTAQAVLNLLRSHMHRLPMWFWVPHPACPAPRAFVQRWSGHHAAALSHGTCGRTCTNCPECAGDSRQPLPCSPVRTKLTTQCGLPANTGHCVRTFQGRPLRYDHIDDLFFSYQ